jgi:hypothetical protein
MHFTVSPKARGRAMRLYATKVATNQSVNAAADKERQGLLTKHLRSVVKGGALVALHALKR